MDRAAGADVLCYSAGGGGDVTKAITAADIYQALAGMDVLMGDLDDRGVVSYIDDAYINLDELAVALNKLSEIEPTTPK